MRANISHRPGLAAALLAATLLGGCGGAPEAPPAPPPAEVSAITIRTRPVSAVVDLPARVQAVRTAEVRARVDGIVERRLYIEGTDVRAGAPMFQIDPLPLRASLDAAQAALGRAQAEAQNARANLTRFEPLVARNAISRQEYDAAQARAAQADADVRSAQAQVDQAKLSLGYATVNAPIAGRAGRAQVTEGALVSASAGTLMSTIEQLDPVYVNFSQSSAELLALRRDIASGRIDAPGLTQTRVTLIREDGSVYERSGRMNFLDLAVDPTTGSVSLRAEFPNPTRSLLPGEFVHVRIAVGVDPNGVTVPQRAVQLATSGASVMLVGAKDVATPRPVKVGELRGGQWVIREGLKPGDRVITDGLQKVRPGAPVKITPARGAAPARPAAAAPAR